MNPEYLMHNILTIFFVLDVNVSWPVLEWDSKEVLVQLSQKKKKTLLEKVKVGFPANFIADMFEV